MATSVATRATGKIAGAEFQTGSEPPTPEQSEHQIATHDPFLS
ncbi:MAG: hypothetical protein AAF958_08730 [Planctomycetota bacterium]